VTAAARFREAYGAHRAAEGRGRDPAELFGLPYLVGGPLAKQWAVRARSFDAFLLRILLPAAANCPAGPPSVLDLGAGNGWLCYRAVLEGFHAVAIDVRDDTVDGLGAGRGYLALTAGLLHRVVGSFDALPIEGARFDVAVFNAALHYAQDLATVLREAARVTRPGGRVVILDSPFYRDARDGEAMVAEKRRGAAERFGERAHALMGLPFVEYLTPDRLSVASRDLGLVWRRHRVRYPLWYEARPLVAWLRRRRRPSRFDLWECTVP
jgi:SAM-dependent methyltransferase